MRLLRSAVSARKSRFDNQRHESAIDITNHTRSCFNKISVNYVTRNYERIAISLPDPYWFSISAAPGSSIFLCAALSQSVREMVELPLRCPHLFARFGLRAPKGVLLHGPYVSSVFLSAVLGLFVRETAL
jgi:hypothetical protein